MRRLLSLFLVVVSFSHGWIVVKLPSFSQQWLSSRIKTPLCCQLTQSTDTILALERNDFPLVSQLSSTGLNHLSQPLTYLDSAATSQKPEVVIDAMNNFYRCQNANVHRGAYTLANKATELYEISRQKVQHFINAKYFDEIVFTRGATEAINLVAYSYAEHFLHEGDEILLTVMEHHSNLIPWQMLAKRKGLKLRFIPLLQEIGLDGRTHQELDMKAFHSYFEKESIRQIQTQNNNRIKLVALSHVSNVLGNINPVKEIIQTAHRHGALVLLDACQSVPHMPMDVQELDVDFLAASSHKMCGPFGIGFLYAKRELLDQMPPMLGGGQMIDQVSLQHSTYAPPPFRFEAGTPPIAEAIGLGRAIDYLTNDLGGMKQVHDHQQLLGKYLFESLLNANIDGLHIYGSINGTKRTGIVSFNIAGFHGMDIAMMLDQYGICIRNGHHCAKPLHDALGVSSSMRASVYVYNNQQDVDFFIVKLREVINLLRSFIRK